MLSDDRLRLGPKVTLKLITPPSLSIPELSTAMAGAPDVVPHLIPTPISPSSKISMDIEAANITSTLTPLHSAHSEPVQIHAFSRQGITEVSTPQAVNGPFRILRHLSSGGFAKAMGAEDLPSGRLLCLKVFRKDLLKKNRTEKSILNELEVYKRLASFKECCPATIFLMELEMSFQTKQFVCFAMELMSSDLAHYMRKEPGYCLENARRWSAQLALGINALHTMGIIHRDIKLENILIDMRQNVRIADFGLSYIDKEPKPLDTSLGYSSEAKGTISFMAPEILCNTDKRHSVNYGASVDWWAFGCVFYELISLPNHETLFDSKNAIMDYVAWQCQHVCKSGLFPSFQGLDPIAADLLAGLLNPPVLRYGFQQVTNHRYFSNTDGTSEFHGACSRAVQREEQRDMLPSLVTETIEIWWATPPGRPMHISNMDWRKPRP